VSGLLGNKLPCFKVGECTGCADCDAGKISKRSRKLAERREVAHEIQDAVDDAS
jgi:hypothetical protein